MRDKQKENSQRWYLQSALSCLLVPLHAKAVCVAKTMSPWFVFNAYENLVAAYIVIDIST